jgi:phosphoenolpyruvate carboxylase
MATQHPDNALAPYWYEKPFISTSREVEECYRSFADLGCQEYMWDWEGKFVDEAVVDRLLQKYYDFFRRHPLGEDFRLTYRVPNIQKEGQARLVRAFSGILAAAFTARELKFSRPPLYEVIHPMTTSVDQLKTLQRRFHETAMFYRKIFGCNDLKPEYIGVIPLIEGTGALLKSRKILEQYSAFLEKFSGRRPKIIRPFIARSDPALEGGFVAAVLSAKVALSEHYQFQKDTGISVKPIVGVGSLRFRGGLSPDTIDEFLKTYPGVATVTLQSSFRYDHPLDQVKQAIATLHRRLKETEPFILPKKDREILSRMEPPLVHYYRATIESLGPFINQMAGFIPPRRERIQHTGHFGYSRRVGKKGLKLPRAIPFTAVFYSIGLPPELIGLGRALRDFHRQNLLKDLLRLYPEFEFAISEVGRYFNRENLEILCRRPGPWKKIRTGVQFIEEFLGKKMGPAGPEDLLHRNYTSNVIQHWLRKESMEEDILKAAEIRRSIG